MALQSTDDASIACPLLLLPPRLSRDRCRLRGQRLGRARGRWVGHEARVPASELGEARLSPRLLNGQRRLPISLHRQPGPGCLHPMRKTLNTSRTTRSSATQTSATCDSAESLPTRLSRAPLRRLYFRSSPSSSGQRSAGAPTPRCAWYSRATN